MQTEVTPTSQQSLRYIFPENKLMGRCLLPSSLWKQVWLGCPQCSSQPELDWAHQGPYGHNKLCDVLFLSLSTYLLLTQTTLLMPLAFEPVQSRRLFPTPLESSGSSWCWSWPWPAEHCCPVKSPTAKFPYFKSALVILALALATLGPNSHFLSQILTYTTKEFIKSKKINPRKLLLK